MMRTRKKIKERIRRNSEKIRDDGDGYYEKYIDDFLLNSYYSNEIQWFNWCYHDPGTRTVLLTDFKNGNHYFNQFKKHLKQLLGPKAKIKFEKHRWSRTDWYQNILVKIKN